MGDLGKTKYLSSRVFTVIYNAAYKQSAHKIMIIKNSVFITVIHMSFRYGWDNVIN